jgi:hypothetical protein
MKRREFIAGLSAAVRPLRQLSKPFPLNFKTGQGHHHHPPLFEHLSAGYDKAS